MDAKLGDRSVPISEIAISHCFGQTGVETNSRLEISLTRNDLESFDSRFRAKVSKELSDCPEWYDDGEDEPHPDLPSRGFDQDPAAIADHLRYLRGDSCWSFDCVESLLETAGLEAEQPFVYIHELRSIFEDVELVVLNFDAYTVREVDIDSEIVSDLGLLEAYAVDCINLVINEVQQIAKDQNKDFPGVWESNGTLEVRNQIVTDHTQRFFGVKLRAKDFDSKGPITKKDCDF